MKIVTDFTEGLTARNIYIGASTLSFAIIYTIAKSGKPVMTIAIAVIIVAILMTTSNLLGTALSKRHKKIEQSRRDQRSKLILSALKDNKNTDEFGLYLRAFEITGRLIQVASKNMYSFGFDPRDTSDSLIDFETGLAAALEYDVPLVALGNPGEHHGAGRVTSTKDDWKNDIAVLGKQATVICILPSNRSGTKWEINWVIENCYLYKMIFIIPPQSYKLIELKKTYKAFDWEQFWVDFSDTMRDKKIELPSYDKKGQLFSISEINTISVNTPLNGHYEGLGFRERICTHLKMLTNKLQQKNIKGAYLKESD